VLQHERRTERKLSEFAQINAVIDRTAAGNYFHEMNVQLRFPFEIFCVARHDPSSQLLKTLGYKWPVIIEPLRAVHGVTRVHMNCYRTFVGLLSCAALACALSTPLQAGLILNGGFESGLSNWTAVDQLGSAGTFFVQTGTSTPDTMSIVPPPPQGTQAAMTDAQGPGSHVLYQDFVVPSVVPGALINFMLLINNQSDRFAIPEPDNHLDFSTPALNQQARVDIMRVTPDPFSLSTADVLMDLYQTEVGDPLATGYNAFVFDITPLLQAHAGETLRLRFAETDNVGPFNFGVDAVDVNVTAGAVPEPSMFVPAGVSILILGLTLKRRK